MESANELLGDLIKSVADLPGFEEFGGDFAEEARGGIEAVAIIGALAHFGISKIEFILGSSNGDIK